MKDLYDGVPIEEVRKCTVLSARSLIEQDPAYSFVTARLLLNNICCEVLDEEVSHDHMATRYAEYFPVFIQRGIAAGLLDAELGHFDLPRLAKELEADRDLQFGYLGLQTLYDRYFLHDEGVRIELPQAFFMRVELGNFGDHKFCRDGVWELRVDVGPGYRVYYALSGQRVVLLLCGGDKRTQDADIARAATYWQDWQRRTDDEK